jgi:hypothetical protein
MWTVVLFLLGQLSVIINGQTLREIENNPNNFHLFENFVLTKTVYQQEFQLIEKLQEIKNTLEQRREKIRKYLDWTKNNPNPNPIKVALNLTELQTDLNQLKPFRTYLSELNETSNDLPTNQAYMGVGYIQEGYPPRLLGKCHPP